MAAAPMTGLEKAAVLLKSLSPTVVEKVLSHMDPKQATALSAEIAKAGARPDLNEAMSRVYDEAASVLAEDKKGTLARKSYDRAKPSAVDVRVEGTPTTEPVETPDPLVGLAGLSPDVVTKALDTESARTVSLLMNRMNVEQAGQIYKRLSSAKRKEVAIRLTDVTDVSDELLRHMADAVLKKCQSMSTGSAGSSEQGEREKRMAGLVRSLERTERMETLTALEEADAELAARIKAMLYLFDDILRMENSTIQKLLSEIDMKTLASALYGAQPEISERILANLSRRAQESLKEEIELSGKVQAAKVKQARQGLEEAMQRLDQRGEMLMIES